MMREEDVVIPPFSIHFMTAQHELVQSFGKLCVYSVCALVVAKTGHGVGEPTLELPQGGNSLVAALR